MDVNTNITETHKAALEEIARGLFTGQVALFSCFVNGEPTAAIVIINGDTVTPLFVFPTDTMTLTDHNGAPAERRDKVVNVPFVNTPRIGRC